MSDECIFVDGRHMIDICRDVERTYNEILKENEALKKRMIEIEMRIINMEEQLKTGITWTC